MPIAAPYLAAALLCTTLVAAPSSHAAPRQSADAVAAVVTAYLQDRAAHLEGTPTISVQADGATRHPACDSLQPFLAGGARLRPRMSVGVRCTAPAAWTVYVPTTLSVMGSYVVPTQAIDAGDVIGPQALETRETELLTLPPGTVTRAEDILGTVAARRLAAGRPVRGDALRSADAVQRGQTVRLVVQGSGFVATGEGLAQAGGGPGSRVLVRTASGQTISGIVRDASTVVVPL